MLTEERLGSYGHYHIKMQAVTSDGEAYEVCRSSRSRVDTIIAACYYCYCY